MPATESDGKLHALMLCMVVVLVVVLVVVWGVGINSLRRPDGDTNVPRMPCLLHPYSFCAGFACAYLLMVSQLPSSRIFSIAGSG